MENKKMAWVSKRPEFKYNPASRSMEFSHFSGNGTYVRSLHGPIGAPKHTPNRLRREMKRVGDQ